MPKKKDNVTESSEIPKKIDNEEKQIITNQKLGWVQILLLIGKPLWDAQKKKMESIKWLSIYIRKSK